MIRKLSFVLASLFMVGCSTLSNTFPETESMLNDNSTKSAPSRAALRNFGAAPELSGENWINVDRPLRLSELRGRVVLLNFWTFGCYNCKNVLPYIHAWYDRYEDRGLTVIGVHYPEFAYESDLNNLREAIVRLKVNWPVVQDNAGETWRAYGQRYWPTIHLIDKRGHVRHIQIGEGGYAQMEIAINALLEETA